MSEKKKKKDDEDDESSIDLGKIKRANPIKIGEPFKPWGPESASVSAAIERDHGRGSKKANYSMFTGDRPVPGHKQKKPDTSDFIARLGKALAITAKKK